MKKTLLALLLVLISFQFAQAEDYHANFITEKITVDGKLDEPAWENAKGMEFIVPPKGEKSQNPAIGKVIWDDNYIYVGIKALDKDIIGTYTERDSATFEEDVLEVFLMPFIDQEPYYNFEVNILTTFLDGRNYQKTKPGIPNYNANAWNCKGVLVKTFVEGTPNNSEDVDEYWQLEIAVPFKGLPTLEGKTPNPGDTWKFHLARYNYSKYLPKELEYSSTAHLTKIRFHQYEDFQKLVFDK